jgi:hypothetical protein
MCGAAVLFAASANAASNRISGRIIAAKVHGLVTALNKANNMRKELHDSDAVYSGYVVTTAAKSSVVLLFANGSAVNLGEDSSLSIDEFLMDPFDAKYSAADAKEEPSTSVTKLTLARGQMVGNVKHLHQENGSSYSITTPVGAAGIRGTTFQIAFHPGSTGKMIFSLSTVEGLVALGALDGTTPLIPAGKQLNVTFGATTDPATGAVSIVPGSLQILGLGDISPEIQAGIAAAVAEILANATNLNAGGSPGAIVPPSNTTPGDGKG